MNTVSRFGSETAELGEGPMWSPREGALYWFDVTGRRLYRRLPGEAEATSCPLVGMPGCFGWRRDGGVIFAFRNGLRLGDRPEGPLRPIEAQGVDFAVERFNDGKVDSRGRFWVGSFNPAFKPGGGSLLRVDPDLSVHRMDTGVTMSNGMGWSPDDRVMYFADSRPGCIWQYDFDTETGSIGERRRFISYDDRPGRPDGLTVDAEGFVWVAEVTAGCVARYDPEGRLERKIEVPVAKPTSVIFGGPQYRSLFVTSMRLGYTEEELRSDPGAGGLFVVECDVPGVPEPLFGG